MYVRYDTQDENGETRRERNNRFDAAELNPDIIIEDEEKYLWDWYHELTARIVRANDGCTNPVTWSDIQGWINLTGKIVHPEEIEVLCKMDDKFVEAMNLEISESQERMRAKADKPNG